MVHFCETVATYMDASNCCFVDILIKCALCQLKLATEMLQICEYFYSVYLCLLGQTERQRGYAVAGSTGAQKNTVVLPLTPRANLLPLDHSMLFKSLTAVKCVPFGVTP